VAVRNLNSPNRIIDELDRDKTLVIRTISLIRLMEGGAAIFTAVKINQNIVMVGIIDIIPLVR
jgi:hypothetical protein